MHFKQSSLVLCCLVISACTSHPKPFELSGSHSDDKSNIYIYRPHAMANILVSPQLILNQAPLFDIKNNQHHVIALEHGTHRVSLKLTERYAGNQELLLEVGEQDHYFLKVTSTLEFRKNAPYHREFNIQQVPASTALTELASTHRYNEADRKPDVTNTSDTPVESGDRFSIQKTLNPFSK